MRITGRPMNVGELREALNLLPDNYSLLPVHFTGYDRMEESNGVVIDDYNGVKMLIITSPGYVDV